MNDGRQTDAAQEEVWLEDEHFTLIEEEPSDAERRSRYDDTQRIWCPPRD